MEQPGTSIQDTRHPRGLSTLFLTELWERFSYYGMRAILVLYMVSPVAAGGLGFDIAAATSLYGTYTMAVFFACLPGGFVADRVLGARRAVLIGAVIIVCGQFSMTFNGALFFYGGLVLIAAGTGLLKPNISTMVGSLYRKDDPRRDSGFSIFYMGINIGAVLAPLICGYFAQSQGFKSLLVSWGIDPTASWHWGFGAAGVGMTAGIVTFILQRRRLEAVEGERERDQPATVSTTREPLTIEEWKRVLAIFIFFLFTTLFWSAYEQKGASLNLFAFHLVQNEAFGWSFPSSWLQSLTAFFVIGLAPVFSLLWVRMGNRQPSSPAKFSLGLLFIGLGYLVMIPASALTAAGRISPFWLIALYFLEVVGEMCLSPVGLSTVTKLAPARLLGLMMGVWFLAAALGSKLAGYFSGFFVANDPERLMVLYGSLAVGLLVASGLLAFLTPKIRGMMGGVR